MSVAKYFHISSGLRGAYMPDNSFVIRVFTRKALKEFIQSEADEFRDAGYVGASKSAVARLTQDAWQSHGGLPYVLPLAPSHDRTNYAFGIFAGPATKAEWEEYKQEEMY